MSIKLHINTGALETLIGRTREGARGVVNAAAGGVAAVSVKVNDAIAMSDLQRVADDVREEIALQMEMVGEMVYATHRGNPSDTAEMNRILEYVDSLYEELEGHERELKRMRGIPICTVCGAENAPGSAFCGDCGTPFSGEDR